jgi:hypothetical protein
MTDNLSVVREICPSCGKTLTEREWSEHDNSCVGVVRRISGGTPVDKQAIDVLRSLVEQMRETYIQQIADCPGETVEGTRWIVPNDAVQRVRALRLPTDAELKKVLERAVLKARIEEAKIAEHDNFSWPHANVNPIGRCQQCERIAALEQALAKLNEPAKVPEP